MSDVVLMTGAPLRRAVIVLVEKPFGLHRQTDLVGERRVAPVARRAALSAMASSTASTQARSSPW